MTRVVVWVAVALLLVGTPVFADISSTFDAGVEGWSGTGGPVSWVSTGGNPGGYLLQEDTDAGSMYVIAPAAFLGDLSAYNVGVLSFDGREIDTGSGANNFGTIRLYSGASVLSADPAGGLGEPPAGFWRRYSVPLTAAAWGAASEAAWLTHLSSITSIELVLEHDPLIVESAGLDNFSIRTIPEPSTVLLLGAGILGLVGYAVRRRRGVLQG